MPAWVVLWEEVGGKKIIYGGQAIMENTEPMKGETGAVLMGQMDSGGMGDSDGPHFSRGNIGAILLNAGKINAEQAEKIFALQKAEGLRFGEAAVKLEFVSDADIQHALSRQFDYPYLDASKSSVHEELVAAYQPFSPQVETLRSIRTQLMLRLFSEEASNSLAVVSPANGDGRSYLAANLAVVFSQLGEKTLLIDADMRKPKQHKLFGLDNQSGFSTYLSGRSATPAIRKIDDFVDLSVLTAGAVPPNPQELMYRPQFSDLLRTVTEEYNVVIIDTPAGIEHADTHLIASKAGACLMLTRKHLSRVRDVAQLSEAIRNVGGNIVGGVINDY